MQAVQWSELFSACQGQEESVTDFFMRCAQSACDCGFQCHQCSVNITEYLLLKRLTLGLSDVVLKQVYQMCNSINSVDTLRPMCCSYEAAREDAVSCSLWRETIRAAGTAHAGEEEDSHTPDAAASMVNKVQLPQLCGKWRDTRPGQDLMPGQGCNLPQLSKARSL